MNPNGTTPLWSQVCKNYFTLRKTKRELFKQEDEIVSYISKNSKKYGFDFIITRPGSLIYDKQSQTKLAASKSVSLFLFYFFICFVFDSFLLRFVPYDESNYNTH